MSGEIAQVRRRELASFLRSRRERITPEQVGMAPGGRRRTPGLRREEVAQLAGVGVTWYTWLEQARDIRVSDQVLEAIARTLQFDPHERAHLFTLAGVGTHESVLKDSPDLPPRVQRMLDQLDPLPASVVNGRLDILAYNRTYSRLMDDLDPMPFEDRNSLWQLFTNPRWRAAVGNFDDACSAMVGHFRAAMAEHVGDPTWKCFLKRLQQASPEFVAAWERYEVRAPENRTKRIINPLVGLLQVDYTHLWFGQRLGTRLITYTPADDATEERLQELYELVTATPSLALA